LLLKHFERRRARPAIIPAVVARAAARLVVPLLVGVRRRLPALLLPQGLLPLLLKVLLEGGLHFCDHEGVVLL
jgi:hypothetical protein